LFILKPVSKTWDQWYQELTYHGVGIENLPGRQLIGILSLMLWARLWYKYFDLFANFSFGENVYYYMLTTFISFILGMASNFENKIRKAPDIINLLCRFFGPFWLISYFNGSILSFSAYDDLNNPLSDATYVNAKTFNIPLLVIWIIIISIPYKLQYKFGSRFFLPTSWRRRLYDYERVIAQDFPIHTLDEWEWPEWNHCHEKLHLPSPFSFETLKYSIYSTESCGEKTLRGIYWRTPIKKIHGFGYDYQQNYHPYCLVAYVLKEQECNPVTRQLPGVDEFDD
jgi:hypothetical protein